MSLITRPLLFAGQLYTLIVIAHVVLSWVRVDRGHPAVRFVDQLVEPLTTRIRRALPFVVQGGIDFSPLVLLLAIQLVQGLILSL